MGTTLQLMNLGKVVYMNKSTTSYESFVMRGFRVFDNSLIGQGGLFEIRDVKINPGLINKYYSHEVFIRTLTTVFNDTPAYKMKYSLGRQI
jgi:hypothetical protein